MYKHIEKRVIELAHYTIKNNATVRKSASVFGISKSTVHRDLAKRLPKINPELASSVRKVFKINLKERHIRGGEATRKKFIEMKNNIKNKVS